MARFTIEEEGRPTRSYRLITDAVIVGRLDTADLVLPDTSVSRKHALVERSEEAWVISDNGSANGTNVNGAAIEGRVVLKHGDTVTVGKFSLVFQTDDESDLPEYTDPSAEGGDWQTSPGMPVGNLETLRPKLPPATPDAPAVSSATMTPAPAPTLAAPHLLSPDGTRFDVGDGLIFGQDLPVKGTLPFFAPGAVESDEGGALARRGSALIPLYVNGKSVSARKLVDGDEIRVGSSRFTYHGP